MEITQKLNLTFPVGNMIVHSIPVSYGQYKSVAETLAAVSSRMLRKGLFFASTQHDVVIHSYNAVIADEGTEDHFIDELIRLTSLIKQGKVTPLYDAIESGMIDEENKDYILSEILFFILSCKRKRDETPEQVAMGISADTRNGMATTLNSATELARYLPTLTEEGNTLVTTTA